MHVTLDERQLGLPVDGEAAFELQIRNTGRIIDHFAVEVVGDLAEFSRGEPAVVSVMPGQLGVSRVHIRHPGTAVAAGVVHFPIKVTSREDGSTEVMEGSVQVAAFADVNADLQPETSRGWWSGRHEFAVDNRGNADLRALLDLRGGDGQVRFEVNPPVARLLISPGMTRLASLRVRPRRILWRGAPVTHRFEMSVQADGGEPIVRQGAMVQEPALPKWAPTALKALLAALAALGVLWFAVVRPQIRSAAQDAAAKTVTQIKVLAAQAQQKASDAATSAGQANQQAGKAGQEAGKAKDDAAKAKQAGDKFGAAVANPNLQQILQGNGALPGNPFTHRFELSSPQDNQEHISPPVVNKDTTLALTDLILENSQGDSGVLRLQAGNSVLLSVGLENFRTYDLHYVSAISIPPNVELKVVVKCAKAGVQGGPCQSAVDISGYTLVSTATTATTAPTATTATTAPTATT
jgi:hypothetical protein